MSEILTKEVRVYCWPYRTDLVAYSSNQLLAQFDISYLERDQRHAVLDFKKSYLEKATNALRIVEDQQRFLQSLFDCSQAVCLQLDTKCLSDIISFLKIFELTEQDISLQNLEQLQIHLETLSVDKLFELLTLWHQEFEDESDKSWRQLAKPDVAQLFHTLAMGKEWKRGERADENEIAYSLFEALINQELERFSFGDFLRYIYYHQTEFKGHSRFELTALLELKALI